MKVAVREFVAETVGVNVTDIVMLAVQDLVEDKLRVAVNVVVLVAEGAGDGVTSNSHKYGLSVSVV